jgi:hypothetical protein
MTNRKAVKVTLYFVALWGFLSFWFLPYFPRPTTLLLALLLIPSWFIVRSSEPFPGYKKAWTVVTFLFLAISCVDLLLNARQPYLTLAYQLSFLQLSKLYSVKRPRDYAHILFLAFTMMVVTAIKSDRALFPLMLVPFLVGTVYGLALLTIEREQLLAQEGADMAPRLRKHLRRPSIVSNTLFHSSLRTPESELRSLHPVLSVLSVAAFALTVFFFLFFPRSSRFLDYSTTPAHDKNLENEMFLTGYANTIDLGSLAKILRDPTVVMKVKITPPIPEQQIYLRGMTLDFFDGKGWYQKARAQASEKLEATTGAGIVVTDSERFMDKAHLVQQDFEMLDFDSKTVFYLPPAVALANLNQNVYCDANNYMFVAHTKSSSLAYTVYSYVPEKSSRVPRYSLPARSETQSSSDFSPYLLVHSRLPQKDEIEELANSITKNSASNFDRAKAIESYLIKNYDYTLDLRTINPDQPVHDFLFHDKRGHCELFATSMVLLLRSVDIPARLVTGFRGGDLKKDTNTFEIRKMDAHAWVEAYIEGRGWCQFDPTPASPLEVFSGRLYFKKLKDFYDALRVRWNNMVLDYNNQLRSKLFAGVSRAFDNVSENVFQNRLLEHFWRKFSTNITQPPLLALAGVLLALNIAAVVVSVRLRRKGINISALLLGNRSRIYLSYLYDRIIRAICGRMVRRKAGVTPREFALSLAVAKDKNTELVEELMTIYYALRFGSVHPSNELMRRIDALLKHLR